MRQDLVDELHKIGVEIDLYDVPVILRVGIERYLDAIRYNTNQESLSQIHIILCELRNNNNNI